MTGRKLLAALAVVLLIAAATTIQTAAISWTPSWPVRIAMALCGLILLAIVGLRGRS